MVWFSRTKIPGGLAFGAPAWMPERVENTFEEGVFTPRDPSAFPAVPRALPALIPSVASATPSRASAILPGLLEQLRQLEQLGQESVRALALILLPTQPEFILGPALSTLAMEDLCAGLGALQGAVAAKKTFVVFDRHDFHTRRMWKKNVGKLKVRCVGLVNRYPLAHPTLLARSLMGEKLAVDALPTTRGIVLVDPVSCWGLGRFLRTGQLMTERPVQVFLENTAPRLVMGRMGETVGAMLKRYQMEADLEKSQVILNGMMTGREAALGGMATIELCTESVSIRERVGAAAESACIACGWCVDVCPTGLTPVHLMQLNQKNAVRSREASEARHCIGCGLCTYICPTRLPLMEETLGLKARVGGKG